MKNLFLLLIALLTVQLAYGQFCNEPNPEFCPGNFFQNGDFETVTDDPNAITDQDVDLATGWAPMWGNASLADLHCTGGNASTGTAPTPNTNVYAGIWIEHRPVPSAAFTNFREGMYNRLNTQIPYNSGAYTFNFNMANSLINGGQTNDEHQIAIYGVYNPNDEVANAPTGTNTNPANLDIWQSSFPSVEVVRLGTVTTPPGFTNTWVPQSISFNSIVLPTNGITHIMLLADDQYLPPTYRKIYVNFDEFCLQERPTCEETNGLSMVSQPAEPDATDCCFLLDYANVGTDDVYAVRLTMQNGVEFAPGYTIAPGFFAPNYSSTSMTITNDPLSVTPISQNINNLLYFCLTNINSTPQFMTIEYLGEDFETVICDDELAFACGVNNGCLEYVQDSLVCTDNGYLYTIDFDVPYGNIIEGGIGYIELHLDPNNLPPGSATIPATYTFSPPLQGGDQTTLTLPITTPIDLFGDSLCVIITAHDDEEEQLCCFAYEACIPFPDCADPVDPCDSVSVSVLPVTDEIQVEECCFELYITDTYTPNPGLFTAVQANIITPGISFTGLSTLPAILDGWTYTANNPTDPTSLNWMHSSGSVPLNTNYNLFDFCVEGTTSTDSIYIEINWLNGDLVECSDTVAVYCPFCLTVVNDDLDCVETPTGLAYLYDFSFTNYSPFDVNAIAINDTDGSPGVVANPGVFMLNTIVPPGGTYTGTVSVLLNGNPGDEVCFDIVLRQIIGDDINITCCYAVHCVELEECTEFRECIDQVPEPVDCPAIYDPVCGCDNMTYANLCYAQNAGVTFLLNDGPCEGFVVMDSVDILLEGQIVDEGVNLSWSFNDDPSQYDFFLLYETVPGFEANLVATIAANGMDFYQYLRATSVTGQLQYRIVGVLNSGWFKASNTLDIFRPEMMGLRSTNIHAWPSPAGEELQLYINRTGAATIEVISTQGQINYQQSAKFEGAPVTVPLRQIADGVHLIRVRFADGEVVQQRIVRVRE